MKPRTALLIIDMQGDFLPPNGSLAVSGGRDIIEPIVKLMTSKEKAWDAIVMSKDWHPHNHISFARSHGESYQPYTPLTVKSPIDDGKTMVQTLWPVHCVQKSEGAEVAEPIQKAFDAITTQGLPTLTVLKGSLEDREYYSCFKDVWGIDHTKCCQFLQDNNIENVVVVGLAYDFCVFHSSSDSAKSGFHTTVLRDLARAVDPTKNAQTEKQYRENGVTVSTLEEWESTI